MSEKWHLICYRWSLENNVKDDMIIMENLIPKVFWKSSSKAKLSLNFQGFVFIDQGWVGEGGEQQEAHVDLTVPPTFLIIMDTFLIKCHLSHHYQRRFYWWSIPTRVQSWSRYWSWQVKEVAKFHAISFCMKEGNCENLFERFPTLREDRSSEERKIVFFAASIENIYYLKPKFWNNLVYLQPLSKRHIWVHQQNVYSHSCKPRRADQVWFQFSSNFWSGRTCQKASQSWSG